MKRMLNSMSFILHLAAFILSCTPSLTVGLLSARREARDDLAEQAERRTRLLLKAAVGEPSLADTVAAARERLFERALVGRARLATPRKVGEE